MASLLRKICEWTLSKSLQSELLDLKPIDFHSHVGNILERNNRQILDEKPFPIDLRTIWWNYWGFHAPWVIATMIMHTEYVDNVLKASGKLRNDRANLKNFAASMDDSCISQAVCLPIPPFQSFKDLQRVERLDKRIIPFTWVDFTKEIDLQKLEEQFKSDVKNGAKWLKIHPIIQWVQPDSDIMHAIVELWSQFNLPILFHTWVTEYSTKKKRNPFHKPEYGEIKYFIDIVSAHPNAKIVIGHSGLFQVEEVIQYLSCYHNVVVDTSFQSKEKILRLLNTFWTDRLMFASDWPYGDRVPAVNVMYEAIGWRSSLVEKVFRNNALESMNLI